MSTKVPYTAAQLDLMKRIERTTQSRELRAEIQSMRNNRTSTELQRPEIVRGEKRVTGFTRNENNQI